MTNETGQETLLEFPCAFELKAMGKSAEDFEQLVLSLVRQQVPELAPSAARTAPSKGGKYTSVTVAFEAQSKAQLDAIYQLLVDEPRVLYAL